MVGVFVLVLVALSVLGFLHLTGRKRKVAGVTTPAVPKLAINKKWLVWGVGATLLLTTLGVFLWYGWGALFLGQGSTETGESSQIIDPKLLFGGGMVVVAWLSYLYWKGGIKPLIPVGIITLAIAGIALVGWWGYKNLDLGATVGTATPRNPLERLQAVGQDFVPGLWTTVALLEHDVFVLGVPIATYWILMAMVGTLVIGWGKGAFHDWFLALLYSIVLIFASQVLSNILLGMIEPRTNVLTVVVGVGYFLASAFAVRKFSIMGLALVAAISWPILIFLSQV